MPEVIGESAEEYLAGIPMWARKKNSLEDIRAFLEELGSPDEGMRFFHVAGTNGKGSVCAYLTSILGKAGYRVGTFVSPHLVEVRERFLIDGAMVSAEAFERSFARVKCLAETMQKRGFSHPSYFEFLFYMAMCLFQEADLDYVILETGLGGRLDTTNVIRHPAVTVITSISLDHMEYLGNTVPAIAVEKAGIIKEGVPVVYDCTEDMARAVIEETASRKEAPLYPAVREDYEITAYGGNSLQVKYRLLDGTSLCAKLSSAAQYQASNGLLAVRAMEAAFSENPISPEILAAGLSAMKWPARMEEALPGLYLDGAHNDGGIREFVKTAARLCQEEKKRAYLLFSSVSDKDYGGMIRELVRNLPLDGVVVAAMESERGTDTGTLEEEFFTLGVRTAAYPSVREAVEKLLSCRDEEHLLFCVGSLYLMGEVKRVLRRKEYD